MEENELYPVHDNLEEWHEIDCDEVFVNCYHNRHMLNDSGGVYMGDDTWVYPDGNIEEY